MTNTKPRNISIYGYPETIASSSADISGTNVGKLDNALNPDITTDGKSPPIINNSNENAVAPNKSDVLNENGTTNTPSQVTGNATTSESAIKKSNQSISKACDNSSYVGKTISSVGSIAGKLIRELRDAIRSALKALGYNPGTSALMSQIRKLTEEINHLSKFINDINNELVKFIAYVNAIKQLISYMLSLPARLISYFSACINLLKKQLVTGLWDELSKVSDPTDIEMQTTIQDISKEIETIKSNLNTFTSNVTQLTTTVSKSALSLVTPQQLQIANTQIQSEATKNIFSAAGFSDTRSQYTNGKP